jgi:hypothetical protein
VGFGGSGARPARQPVLSAKLIENRTSNSNAHVPFETLVALTVLSPNRIPKAAHASGD